MVFDDTGNCANITRYVPNEDALQSESILVSHVPLAQRNADQYSISRDHGFLVITGPLQQIKLLDSATE